jgi:hypothetical protein
MARIFNAAQAARNALGPVEDELERRELELGRAELALLERSEVIKGQIKTLVKEDFKQSDLSDSESVSSHYSFETEPPDRDAMHLPMISRSDIDAHERLERDLIPDSSSPGEECIVATSASERSQKASQNFDNLQIEDLSESRMHRELLDSKSLADHSLISWIGNSRDYKTASPLRYSTEPPFGIAFIDPITEYTSTPIYPRTISSADIEGYEDTATLDDPRGRHLLVNEWLLHKLWDSKDDQSLLESMLPQGLHLPPLKDHAFIKIWNSDKAAMAHVFATSETESAIPSIIINSTQQFQSSRHLSSAL